MASEYHLWVNDEAAGPYTQEQLSLMLSSGKVTKESLASPDRGITWITVTEVLAEPPIEIVGKDEQSPSSAATVKEQKEQIFACRCCCLVILSPILVFIALLVIGSYMPPAPEKTRMDRWLEMIELQKKYKR